jgi:hypothetical protein
MTASHCDRCGKTASLQPVTVLGDYWGRGLSRLAAIADACRKAREGVR